MKQYTKVLYVDIDTGECLNYEQVKALHTKTLKTEICHTQDLNNLIIHTTKIIKVYGRKPEQRELDFS